MRYEKGRKDASRQRIMEVAVERFRNDGIAASGLAAIMGDAGLTNGAFYPHFPSKTALVHDSIVAALENQSKQAREILGAGGLEAAITTYLSVEHRDNPGKGCIFAALLPELARQSPDTRSLCAESLHTLIRQMSAALPPETEDPEGVALGVQALLIGALQLARATEGTALSDRILAAGASAARALIEQRRQEESP